MPVDPDCQAVLDTAAERGSVFDARSPDEARALYDGSTAVFAPETPDLESVEDMTVPGPDGDVPVRLYTPRGGEDGLPVLVFFHGGGWVFGNLETHDAICRIVADAVPCLVAAVDYRLAPENPYPAAVEDCYAAVEWFAEHADEVGGDPARLAVGGDSAGGNLAAVVALKARDESGPELVFQWLVYPATDFTADTTSIRENGEGYLLTKASIDWCKEQYLPGDGVATDPYASPALASDLGGLPPAFVLTAEYDPLRDEGAGYADRLAAAGVQVDYRCYDGMVHGFMRMGALVGRAHEAMAEGAEALRDAFAG